MTQETREETTENSSIGSKEERADNKDHQGDKKTKTGPTIDRCSWRLSVKTHWERWRHSINWDRWKKLAKLVRKLVNFLHKFIETFYYLLLITVIVAGTAPPLI